MDESDCCSVCKNSSSTLVSDELVDDDELLEFEEVFDDEPLEEEVLLLESVLPELPLALSNRISMIVPPLELPELPEVPAVLEPPKPPPGGGPPAPPGPLANALLKMLCNSLPWLLVSVPLCTCCEIKLLIVDCMLDAEGGPDEDDASLCS